MIDASRVARRAMTAMATAMLTVGCTPAALPAGRTVDIAGARRRDAQSDALPGGIAGAGGAPAPPMRRLSNRLGSARPAPRRRGHHRARARLPRLRRESLPAFEPPKPTFEPAPPEPAPAVAPVAAGAPTLVPPPAKPARKSGVSLLNVALGVAVLVATAGVAFAVGRTTAPAATSQTAVRRRSILHQRQRAQRQLRARRRLRCRQRERRTRVRLRRSPAACRSPAPSTRSRAIP